MADPVESSVETYPPLAPRTAGRSLPLPDDGAPVASPATIPDAPADSSPANEEAVAAPESQVEQPITAEPEKKFNMPPQERWEAMVKDKQEAERRAQQAEAMARMALEKLQPTQAPTAQQEIDRYAGMAPETAEFYRNLDRRIDIAAEQKANEKLELGRKQMEAMQQKVIALEVDRFREKNPGIKPNSAEETAISGYINQGHTLDNAKKLALFDSLESENKQLKQKQSNLPKKVAASNVERGAGIPESAGLPPRQGNWRAEAGDIMDRGGDIRDVANALFGKRRK